MDTRLETHSFRSPRDVDPAPWVRSFVASVSSAIGVDPDTSDDLRLAVSELAAVAEGGDEVPLEARIDVFDEHAVVTVGPVENPEDHLDDEDTSSWDVVFGLFPDADFEDDLATISVPRVRGR